MDRTSPRTSALPRWSITALVVSVLATLITGALGPSAAVPVLPGRRWGPLPPYFWDGPRPASAYAVSGLLALGVLAGAAGLLGVLRALARGWQPDPRRVVAAGVIATAALAVLPPVGSADPKSYAAYGRMAATGSDPYTTSPRQLGAAGDPFGVAVESPWQDTPSVYGPLATAEQALVAKVAGDSPRAAVGLLGLINAAGFLAAGALLQRLAGSLPRRRRVALLWSANPLLLLQAVAGAHLDTLVAFAMVGAVALSDASGERRRTVPLSTGRRVAAGAAAGAAAAIKLPGGAVAAVMAWRFRRSPRELASVMAGAATVLGVGYAFAGPHALDQVRRASRFVSHASPWRPLAVFLDGRLGTSVSRTVISAAAVVVTAVLVALFLRALPGRGEPGCYVTRATLGLTLAYLLATPYVLPWYGLAAWALIALLPDSGFDRILVMYTTVLSLAYIPGRDVALPAVLDRLADIARNTCAPFLLLGVLVWAVAVARRDSALNRVRRNAEE